MASRVAFYEAIATQPAHGEEGRRKGEGERVFIPSYLLN
jgi:hypothetical protein